MQPRTVYLIGVLLVGIVALGVLANDQIQYNSLADKYNSQSLALSNSEQALTKLKGELLANEFALNASVKEQQLILANYTKSQGSLNAPGMNQSIIVWTIQRTLTKDNWTAWALLDTFVNNIDVKASGEAAFQIMTLSSFASFYYHQPYATLWNYTGTHFLATVRLTQGCGYYVLLIKNLTNSSIILVPDVTARYAPAPFGTGACSP